MFCSEGSEAWSKKVWVHLLLIMADQQCPVGIADHCLKLPLSMSVSQKKRFHTSNPTNIQVSTSL